MNESTYQRWQALHDRWARGEALTPEEQSVYEAGCAALDAEETFPGQLNELRAVHAKADALEAQLARAQAEYETLRADIVRTEARLSEPTRRRLGISNS